MGKTPVYRAQSVGFIDLGPDEQSIRGGVVLVPPALRTMLAGLLAKAWRGEDLPYRVFFDHIYSAQDDSWVLALDVHYSEGTSFKIAFTAVGDTDWSPVLSALLSEKVLLVWDQRAIVLSSEPRLPLKERAALFGMASLALEGGIRETLLEHVADMRREATFLNTLIRAVDRAATD